MLHGMFEDNAMHRGQVKATHLNSRRAALRV
jgi:hypothetical protein